MHKTLLAALATTALAGAAHAAVSDLNFENIAIGYPFSNNVQILNYYNGGTSSVGTSGPNFGVSFSTNALVICLNSLTVDCSNTSRGGLDPSSATGGLFFLSGTAATMDVAAGFSNGFSFNYSEPNTPGGVVNVWSGLDGTGTLLATFTLGLTPSGCPGYPGAYCPFVPIGVSFAGVAESVQFGGVANFVVFDDVTFGSPRVGGSPEPATWAMMLAGLAGAGAMLRRRRSLAAA
jgi:hypothetical protein